MQVIPGINETDFPALAEKIARAADFGAEWVHLDVADGQFTENVLWNRPADLESLKGRKVKLEVHLMVQDPERVMTQWLSAGVQRVIVHTEATRQLPAIQAQCDQAGVELVIALNPETSPESFQSIDRVTRVLVLAVKPGLAGQQFRNDQLDKIRFLRTRYPNVTLSVDGGVTLDNAPELQAAGADTLVAASAIWNSADPAETYRRFQNL